MVVFSWRLLRRSLCVEDYLKVYSNLTVDGNVYIRDVESGYKQGGSLYGQLYVFQGNLHIKGNLEAESKLSSTGICMMGSSAYALVEGDYRVLDAKFGTSQQEGILEIKGDVDIRRQLYGNSRFKLVLGGDKKQNVFIGDDPRDLVIELKNRSEEGVCLENIFGVSQWILNDCNLTYQGISCMTGYTNFFTTLDCSKRLEMWLRRDRYRESSFSSEIFQVAGRSSVNSIRLDISRR